jgi:hypothetical protein
MEIVKVRSPYIIEVPSQGGTHTGSKLQLTIWNSGSAEPTIGQTGYYELTKLIPSTTQRDTYYNVSNYVKEFIDNITPNNYNLSVATAEAVTEWCIFHVVAYWYNSSTSAYVLLTDEYYYGVNGFTDYSDGNQSPSETKLELLANTNIINYYFKNSFADLKMEYLNLLYDKLSTDSLTLKYERIDGTVYSATQNILNGIAGTDNLKIPISSVIFDGNFVNGCKVTITYTPASASPIIYIFYTYPIEECKYTPVRCSFINRYGGWKDIIFFKAQTNVISVKGTDFKSMPSEISYNTSKGQVKTFNTNGTQNIKLNTGFVDENYSELITDLLLSETVLLDAKPVTLKTQSNELKTSLKDKLINYEIEFEYAYNLINDVV